MLPEPLDVVVSPCIKPCRGGERRTSGRGCWRLLNCCASPHFRQCLCFLPWLIYLLWGGRVELSGLGWLLGGKQLELCLGLLLLLLAALALLRDHLRSGAFSADLGPPLAALALLLWHLGLPPSPDAPERWVMAVVKAPGRPSEPADDGQTVVGLMLLDDMFRAILRFVASTPVSAWPYAAMNRRSYLQWVQDEEWWSACYRSTNWVRLPGGSELTGTGETGPDGGPSLLRREAMLWAGAMAETLGMMVVLRPRCGAPYWTAAPCVASALLLVSCWPWLPRQSELVFVEMMRLMHAVSKFAVSFQAVWLLALGLLIQPEDIALCTFPSSPTLRLLEMSALLLLYVIVAGRLWLAQTRCRVAEPICAVPVEHVVADPPLRSRPLYCGSLGLVEGSYAPTRPFDAEDFGKAVRWRDRYALRRSAELLAEREAHLLSCLDALDLRIAEAELELRGAQRPCARRPNWQLAAMGLSLCLLVAQRRGWSSSEGCWGLLEGLLYAALLLRMGRDWYGLVASSWVSWDAAERVCYGEVAALRQQSQKLHQGLAQAQLALGHLQTRLADLSIVPASTNHGQHCSPSSRGNNLPMAMLLSWFGGLCMLPCLPEAM